jgi:hypothetical protein
MKFSESLLNGAHANLAKLKGHWKGTTKTWFEPGVLADESPMSGTIRPILGGRFMLYEYSGTLSDRPFEGAAMIGYDLATQTFQSAWVDSFHMSTAIMLSEGVSSESFKATGSYFTGQDTPRWFWRSEIEIIDDGHIVLSAYNISPDGDEALATETHYFRKV